jgi:hypothetical protein
MKTRERNAMNVALRLRFELHAALLLASCALLGCKGSRESGAHAAANTPASSSAATEPNAATEPAPSTSPAAPAAAAPKLPVRSLILGPSFVAASGPFAAGTAFPLREPRAPSGVLVLSCHHIFGPLGGLAADVAGSALPAFIQKASVADQDGKTFALGPVLPVPNAKTFHPPTRDASADVSVFQAPAELAHGALELAPALPEKGERVWLLARVSGQSELVWPAVAFFVTDTFFVYQFDSPTIDLRGTSGAPVVNAKGQLVAVNLGGNPVQDVVRGAGTPLPSLRRALDVALAK